MSRIRFFCYAIMLLSALTLSGCGGSGGGGGPHDEGFDRARRSEIFDAAGYLAQSARYGVDIQGSSLVEYDAPASVPELKAELPHGYAVLSGAHFNGVTVGGTPAVGVGSVLTYGGWLDYSYFEVRGPGGGVPIRGDRFNTAFAFSIGNPTGRNPARGSVTWKGATVGFDLQPQSAWSITGGATLTVDFAAFSSLPDIAAVDVHLHDLRRADDARYTYGDIEFPGVPMVNGVFEDRPVTISPVSDGFGNPNTYFPLRNHITGAFYGANHEEAGGTFTVAPTKDYRDGVLVGAFGAKRAN